MGYNHDGPGELKFFLIGLTLAGMITAIGAISGGAINPAVGLVQPIFQGMALNGTAAPQPAKSAMWLNILGPILGGTFAGLWTKLDASANQKVEESAEAEKGP